MKTIKYTKVFKNRQNTEKSVLPVSLFKELVSTQTLLFVLPLFSYRLALKKMISRAATKGPEL